MLILQGSQIEGVCSDDECLTICRAMIHNLRKTMIQYLMKYYSKIVLLPMLRQQATLLAGRDVYFWGCGAAYKKFQHIFATAKVRCIFVDLPNPPQSVDGIPVRHPAELCASAKKLPMIVFTNARYRKAIKDKLHGEYSFLVAGEPIFAVDYL